MPRATPTGTIAAHVVLRIVAFCQRRGHDPAQLCANAGSSLEYLSQPDARVPYAVVARLGELALLLTGDEDFGLNLARDVEKMENFDTGVLLLMASPTVGAALERFAANKRYWGDGDRSTLARIPGGIALRYLFEGAGGEVARHSNECALAELTLGVRVLSGQPLRPLVVRFAHRRPRKTTEHEKLFACPIEFGAELTEIVFDDETLQTPMQHANQTFLTVFEKQMEAALARLPKQIGTSDAVRAAARAALAGGNCTLPDTARTLAMSVRTLQRRLKDEGTSFVEVIDALRREMAVAYLQRQMPIPDIAEVLGYADATAFHHAFRRWTGHSPARYGRVER
jgi:AraC-like DNA-binding protein